MITGREAIEVALFILLSASAGYITTSRKMVLWDQLGPDQKPALYLQVPGEDHLHEQAEGIPDVTVLTANVFIYAHVGDGQVGSTILNALLDALSTALTPNVMTGRTTLGGLVSHVWIEGTVFRDPGDLDNEAVAVVPLRILVP